MSGVARLPTGSNGRRAHGRDRDAPACHHPQLHVRRRCRARCAIGVDAIAALFEATFRRLVSRTRTSRIAVKKRRHRAQDRCAVLATHASRSPIPRICERKADLPYHPPRRSAARCTRNHVGSWSRTLALLARRLRSRDCVVRRSRRMAVVDRRADRVVGTDQPLAALRFARQKCVRHALRRECTSDPCDANARGRELWHSAACF